MTQELSDKEIVAKAKQEHEKKVSKDKDFPTEIISLPSKGYFYLPDNPLSSGEIELRYPTAREEDILTSRNLLNKGLALDRFLQSIIVSEGVDYNSILLGDKDGIMYASRILAYGPDYEGEVMCPNPVCGYKNKVKIDISSLETKDVPFDEFTKGQQEFNFVLPTSKKSIKFKLLTHADEQAINDEIAALKKKSLLKEDKELTTRLKYSIIEVDGDKNKSSVFHFVDNLLARDSLALRKEINRISPDINNTFQFNCTECNYSEELMIPLGISLFWPSGRL